MWADGAIEGATRVGTLTVRRPPGPGAPASTAVRLAVESQLAGAELTPPGAPPSAVLVVRRLADPLPGRLAARPGRVRTDPSWEGSVRARLGELYRAAPRPADGPVPAGAAAVRFRDRAELLACLARDLAAGGAADWWWRTLRRQLPAEVGPLLAACPRELPAVLLRLAELGAVASVAAAVGEGEAREVLARAVDAHRLDPALLPPSLVGAVPAASARADAPWARWLPALAAELPGPVRSALLGIGIGVARRPSVVRAAWFVAEVRRYWRASESRPSGVPADPSAGPSVGSTASSAGVPADSSAGSSSGVPATSSGSPEVPADSSSGSSSGVPATSSAVPGTSSVGSSTGVPATSPAGFSGVPAASSGEPSSGVPATSSAVPDTSPEAVPGTSPEASELARSFADHLADGVDTGLGGVLYLINALPHLDDGGDSVWRRSSRVGGWGVLERVARDLLGDADPDGDLDGDLDADPIWTALAALDGREPDRDRGEAVAREPWLDRLLPPLRARLAAALGEGPWRAELATELLAVPGRLYVTATHVDLVAPLDRISLPARRAGLDRDPGWVPELGRVVLFHFE